MRWIIYPLFLATVLLGGGAAVVWQRRDAPAANWFAVLVGLIAVGAAVIGITIAMSLSRTILLATTIVIGLVTPIPWLFFCLEYTGRNEFVSPRVGGAVSALPAGGLLATTVVFGAQVAPGVRLPTQRAASGLTAAIVAFLNVGQWLALLYAGGLVFVGAGLLLWTFHRYEYLDPTTGMLLGTLGTIPWLSVLFGLQLDGTAPWVLSRTVGVGLLIGGLVTVAALGPYRLFHRIPAAGNVGPGTVVENLSDLVVVTDSTESVVDLNDAAVRTLDMTAPAVVGATVTELLGSPVQSLRETDTVELSVGAGDRLFEPTVSELTDQHGHRLGYAVVLRDVTDRTIRQQRLEVFNRVLRHNLRNKMTVILGHAEVLGAEADDPDTADRAEAIADAATDLTSLSEQAREIEQTLTEAGPDRTTAPLRAVVKGVLSDIDTPDSSVSIELPENVVVEESADLVELAVHNLVTNAIEHNDNPVASVEIRASYEADRSHPLHLTVADDGPGIPDHEIKVLERGTETPLEHGTGLGLWVVRWAMVLLGGDVTFRDRDPRGTVVSIRLRNVARRTATDGASG